MALEPLVNGTLADATTVNSNFNYLDGRITTTASSISSLSSQISTVNTNLSNSIASVSASANPTFTQLASSGSISLTTNSINTITPTGAVTFVLPTVSSDTKLNQILVQVNMTTVYSINVGTTHYFNGKSPDMSSIGKYNLIFEYDETNNIWVCGWMGKS